jgi:hypothetical protein
MNHMRRPILFKNIIRIFPHSQIPIFAAEKDPSLALEFVGVGVRFDGLAYEAGATGYEDGGEGVA